MAAYNLTGLRFGRLTVIERADDNVCKSGYRTAMWRCVCDCGNEVVVRGKSLSGGVTKSCGCLARDVVASKAKKHGGFGTRLYAIWNSMRQRCNNNNHHSFLNYGGRGITICDEWNDYAVFREWAHKSGYDESSPRGMCTLDRIDVNDSYNPDNCRWVDMRVQSNNKRQTLTYTLNGVTHSLTEWSDITGIKYQTLWKRYKAGKNAEQALT